MADVLLDLVLQGVGFVPDGRHGEHLGRLGDDDQVRVFKNQLEAQIPPRLVAGMVALVRIVAQLEAVARRQPLARLGAERPVELHAAVIEQPDNLAARQAAQLLHEQIDPLAQVGRSGGDVGSAGGQRHEAARQVRRRARMVRSSGGLSPT